MPSRSTLAALVALAVMVAAISPARVSAQDGETPATELRVTMARLLAEHALLSIELVRSAIAETPDFDAAAADLERNTSEIVAAIEGVFGPEAGAAFAEQWRNHIGYLFDYARARAGGDADAAELASRQLDRYVADFSALLADALPVLPRDTVTGLVDVHVEQLEHVAAFDEGDFGQAYPAIRDTYRHMFDIGDGLVIGIVNAFPDRFPGRDHAFSPATDLRVSLDRLLGEHTHLAALAMRATFNDAADAADAADALAANSTELTGLIADIYGDAAGTAFETLWDDHIDWYLAYVEALADDDEAAAARALAGLNDYRRAFRAFVTSANPLVAEAALAELVRSHSTHLVRQTDAYVAGDFEAAHELAREAYAHAGELSASLAAAIGDQFPQRFPDAAMTERVAPWPVAVASGLLLLLAAGAIGVAIARRRRAAGLDASVSE